MKTHNFEQGSPEWHQIRVGKITGSSAGRLLTSKAAEYIDQIVAERIEGMSDDQFETFESFDMVRGKELEPLARQMYSECIGVEVQQFGFIEMNEFYGYSPDGLVADGAKFIGAVEIKSPRMKKHIKIIRNDKILAEYLPQVLAPFICDENIEWVDFISFNPDAPEDLIPQMWVIRATREEFQTEINDLADAIKKAEIKIISLENKLKVHAAKTQIASRTN